MVHLKFVTKHYKVFGAWSVIADHSHHNCNMLQVEDVNPGSITLTNNWWFPPEVVVNYNYSKKTW